LIVYTGHHFMITSIRRKGELNFLLHGLFWLNTFGDFSPG
jgi:hypothetical protein